MTKNDVISTEVRGRTTLLSVAKKSLTLCIPALRAGGIARKRFLIPRNDTAVSCHVEFISAPHRQVYGM